MHGIYCDKPREQHNEISGTCVYMAVSLSLLGPLCLPLLESFLFLEFYKAVEIVSESSTEVYDLSFESVL
jgi:hypothetical protein